MLLAVFLLSACQNSEKQGDTADNTADLKEVFGCDFSQVRDTFQWPMEESQKQDLSMDAQPEKLEGYSVELKDVAFLGEKASSVYLQFLGKTQEDAVLNLLAYLCPVPEK